MKFLNHLRRHFLLKKAQKSAYFFQFYEDVDLNRKVKETTFVVFDCEATDLNPKKAKLLSVGAVKVKNLELEISSSFYRLVKESEVKAAEIHGITKEDLEKYGRPPEEVIEDFLLYIKGSVLVGFYVKFDISLIEKYSLNIFNYPITNYKIDVFNLYKGNYPGQKSLEDMANEFGFSVKGRHIAIDDAYTTALIFLKLIYSYREEKLKSIPLFL